jgi:hypothetical protein
MITAGEFLKWLSIFNINTSPPPIVTYPIAVSQGGTGQTTQTSGFNALSPLTTLGDLIGFDGTNNVRFPVGTTGFILTADPTSSVGFSWQLNDALVNPMTTLGDIITGGASGVPQRLGIGTTGFSLIAGSSPSWGLPTLLGTVTQGTWTASTIAPQFGGTGQTTLTAAFNALSPLSTSGDLLIFTTATLNTRLALGTTGQYLISNGTIPTWANLLVNLATQVTGNLSTGNLNSGTSASSMTFWRGDGQWATPPNTGFPNPLTTLGDILVGGASGSPSRLPIGTNGQSLIANSAATFGMNWALPTLLGTVTTGTWNATTIAVVHGGTGATTAPAAFTALSPLTIKGDLLSFSTLNARLPVGTNGQFLTANSTTSTGLQWSAVNLSNATSVTGNLPINNLNSGSGASSSTFWRGDGTWATPAVGFTNPMTSYGDLIAGGIGGFPERLAAGANGLVLIANSSASVVGVNWAQVDLTVGVTNNLPVTNLNSGTSASSATFWRGDGTWAVPSNSGFNNPMTTVGDIILGGTAGAAQRLGVGANGNTLIANSSATNGISWGTVSLSSGTAVSGNLPVTNLNSGTSASSATFWRGDGTWATPIGFANPLTTLGDIFVGGASGTPERLPIATDGFTLVANSAATFGMNWALLPLSSTTGNLPPNRLNSGSGASSTTFWRGDGTWAPFPTSAYIPEIIDQFGNPMVQFVSPGTAAINFIQITSGLSGSWPSIVARTPIPGGDSDVGLVFQTFGGGEVQISGGSGFNSVLRLVGYMGGSAAIRLQSSSAITNFGLPLSNGTTGYVLTNSDGAGNTHWALNTAFQNPLTNIGDMMYNNASNITTRLPIAVNGSVLSVNLNVPYWTSISLGNPNSVSGNLPVTNLNSGTSATNLTFWRGDGVWAVPRQTYQFTQQFVATNQANLVIPLPSGAFVYELDLAAIIPNNGNDQLKLEFSTNGGSTYVSLIQTATGAYAPTSGAVFGISGLSNQSFALVAGISFFVGPGGAYGKIILRPAPDGSVMSYQINTNYLYSAGPALITVNESNGIVEASGVNAIRLSYASSNISGTINLNVKNSF